MLVEVLSRHVLLVRDAQLSRVETTKGFRKCKEDNEIPSHLWEKYPGTRRHHQTPNDNRAEL